MPALNRIYRSDPVDRPIPGRLERANSRERKDDDDREATTGPRRTSHARARGRKSGGACWRPATSAHLSRARAEDEDLHVEQGKHPTEKQMTAVYEIKTPELQKSRDISIKIIEGVLAGSIDVKTANAATSATNNLIRSVSTDIKARLALPTLIESEAKLVEAQNASAEIETGGRG